MVVRRELYPYAGALSWAIGLAPDSGRRYHLPVLPSFDEVVH